MPEKTFLILLLIWAQSTQHYSRLYPQALSPLLLLPSTGFYLIILFLLLRERKREREKDRYIPNGFVKRISLISHGVLHRYTSVRGFLGTENPSNRSSVRYNIFDISAHT